MLTTHSTAIGVFRETDAARRAVEALRSAGFTENEVGVIARESAWMEDSDVHVSPATRAGEGALGGAVAGAGMGGLWAIGIAAGVLPAIGPVIAGGLLASLAASAATGAAAGSVVGALIGLGVPEEDAAYYDTQFQEGRVIVTVHSDDRANDATEILRAHGAYDVQTRHDVAETAEPHAATSEPPQLGRRASVVDGSPVRADRELPDPRAVDAALDVTPLDEEPPRRPR